MCFFSCSRSTDVIEHLPALPPSNPCFDQEDIILEIGSYLKWQPIVNLSSANRSCQTALKSHTFIQSYLEAHPIKEILNSSEGVISFKNIQLRSRTLEAIAQLINSLPQLY